MADALLEAFGQAVRARRRDMKLSQAELAAAIGGRQATVSDIENAVRPADFSTLQELAHALGCRIVFNPDRSITLERA